MAGANGAPAPTSLSFSNKAYVNDTDLSPVDLADDVSGRRDEAEEEQSADCGWSALRLPRLNFCRTAKYVLVFFCLAGTVQGMLVNGFVNVVISTIESRFGLSSKESGLIVISYDIASVLCLIPVTYLGGAGNKPRWVAGGVFLMGIGSIVFAIPHFAAAAHVVSDNGSRVVELCTAGNDVSLCDANADLLHLVNYKYVFIVAQLLHGAGASPLFSLAITYIDENVKTNLSSLYIGIFYMMSIVGPAIGYVAGGTMLNLYTDFHRVDVSSLHLTTRSHAWIGAWWLGFLIAGVLALTLVLPILAFPRVMPGLRELQESRVSEAHGSSESAVSEPHFGKTLRDSPRAVLNLISNPTFMLLSMAGAVEGFLVTATSTFAPKFIEAQFSLTASWAGSLIGFATVPAGGGGMFIGGYIVKRFNMKCGPIIKLCVAFIVVSLVAVLSLLVRCPQTTFAGVNMAYSTNGSSQALLSMSTENLRSGCNADCHCDVTQFDPVCSADTLTYYSACLAGCSVSKVDDNDKLTLHNCSCIASAAGVNVTQATAGVCEADCSLLPVFLPIFSVLILFTFLSTMPALTATLRCIPEKQRSFGLGIQWFIIRLAGTIPGPIVLGALIDNSCQVWQPGCGGDDGRGACLFYRNASLSNSFLFMGLIGKTLGVVFFVLAFVAYKPPPSPAAAVTKSSSGSAGTDNMAAAFDENTPF